MHGDRAAKRWVEAGVVYFAPDECRFLLWSLPKKRRKREQKATALTLLSRSRKAGR
jgi:hypothetical protein